MSKKIKKTEQQKLKNSEITGKPPIFEHPLFSFRHVTTNSRYNFSCFNSDKMRIELAVRQSLDELLTRLSSMSWVEIITRCKRGLGGYEGLPICQLNFHPSDLNLSPDSKISVIRFGNADAYRLLGYWKDPVFHIIGYDFDYSAYEH